MPRTQTETLPEKSPARFAGPAGPKTSAERETDVVDSRVLGEAYIECSMIRLSFPFQNKGNACVSRPKPCASISYISSVQERRCSEKLD